LGYALDLYADEVAATHAAHVAIVLAPWRRVSLSVSARLLGRASHSDERAGVTVRRVPLLADARVHLVRLGRVAIAAIAGVGVEIVSNDARAFAGLHAAQAADQVFAFVEAGASVSLRLAGQVSLFARLTATVPLERLRYVVSVGPATQVLLSPWRVQPGLRVGLFADVL
ncbi:MAG: hypothetical protein KC503_47510, partial [Myxococcales bacterium]|nr:hypothetical protein [Myxococcales bacterium]